MDLLTQIKASADFILKQSKYKPEIGLILGSGLGSLADTIEDAEYYNYSDIPNFPTSTVEGHAGRLVIGKLGNKQVVAMQGRFHYYEGYSMTDVVLPVRLMKLMGAEVLFLTNASGGVNYDFSAGDFMLIQDQIADFVPSPLIGENIEELGPRFCDMSEVYDKYLRKIIKDTAKKLNIPLKEGVYIQLTGPNFETPAEVRMCRILGADAVGMSTACEGIAANHMGMKICGISCISNLACGMTEEPLSHEEVQATADRVAPLFKKLITASIVKIAENL